MNTRKTVYNKLFKEETQLAKHEVELALNTDVDKAVNDYYNTSNTAYSKSTGAINSLREALAVHNKSYEITKQFDVLLKKINDTAKELGISPNEWQIYKDLNIAIKEKNRTLENIKSLEKAISLLS
jgi:hypothetical protein